MPDIIRDDDAHYAYEIVEMICEQVGPGLPGSSQEGERAALIRKELESHLGAENVVVEKFTFAPWAALGALRMSALLMLLATLLNLVTARLAGMEAWLTAVAALVLSILSPFPYFLEDILGFESIDRLFRKKESANVIGRLIKPGTKNVERLLIVSGHHDSAAENTWLRFLRYGFLILAATSFLGFLAPLAMSLVQVMGLLLGNTGMVRLETVGWILLAYPVAPAVVYALFFNMGMEDGGTVPGAVDNLSGSALAVAMCRLLVNNPSHIPDGTEIRFVSFGSEEAGLRGSRRYVARHLDELKRLEARLLNFEMVAHPEIAILASDVNGTVKHSPEMVRNVVTAAERAGVPFRVQPAHLGIATDAAPFSRAGLKATTLLPFRVPQQMVAFYHQKWDSPDVLATEPLLNVLKLACEWVRGGGE